MIQRQLLPNAGGLGADLNYKIAALDQYDLSMSRVSVFSAVFNDLLEDLVSRRRGLEDLPVQKADELVLLLDGVQGGDGLSEVPPETVALRGGSIMRIWMYGYDLFLLAAALPLHLLRSFRAGGHEENLF